MKYIVKNCPACMVNPMFRTPDYFCNDIAIEERILHCDSRTDCLIKQVIEKCKEHPFKDCACGDDILQLFDIEEINK